MKRFPSPIGELHFSMTFAVHWDCYRMVSVPYRGATFLNFCEMFYGRTFTSVSVPYRGATFLNEYVWCSYRICQKSFRPLSGSYISQSEKRKGYTCKSWVSVPYRGATFLNGQGEEGQKDRRDVSVPYRGATFLNNNFNFVTFSNNVSVPYRGATFLNNTEFCIVQWLIGFRPLSGSYISQSVWDNYTYQVKNVSVPYRGATFLNTIPATPCPVWDE